MYPVGDPTSGFSWQFDNWMPSPRSERMPDGIGLAMPMVDTMVDRATIAVIVDKIIMTI